MESFFRGMDKWEKPPAGLFRVLLLQAEKKVYGKEQPLPVGYCKVSLKILNLLKQLLWLLDQAGIAVEMDKSGDGRLLDHQPAFLIFVNVFDDEQ